MNRSILKKYAPQARRDFIQAVTDRASYYGLTKKTTEPVTVQGDTALLGGRAFPKAVAGQRKRLEERIARQGFDQVIEAVAYTWFNRLVAARFMELHGYLEHGYRVLSHPSGGDTPEVLEHADSADLPGLDQQRVIDLKLAGDKDGELYRMLLIAQCNALHSAMPFLFERIDDETELLLPDNLLHSDSLIRTLVGEIPEEDWQEVEIIGWLYQFYISEKKEEVIGKVVKSEDIPAATQLFTPNWIVKYLVQNSLGRQWVATYPNSSLKGEMEYYIDPAEQAPEVQEQLKAITPDSLDPEKLTLLDPACGSGHILVEAYDLLKAIYQERGYSKNDIPRLILAKNLYGLEVDDRAAQLASFALMMKARADDRRIFSKGIQPQVLSIQDSKGLDANELVKALNSPVLDVKTPPSNELFEEIADDNAGLFSNENLSVKGDIPQADLAHLIGLFEYGKTFGSLIQIPDKLAATLPRISQRVDDVLAYGGLFEKAAAESVKQLMQQSDLLARKYCSVVMNPPYMGPKAQTELYKTFLENRFLAAKNDSFSAFILRGYELAEKGGDIGVMCPFVWMFIGSYGSLRKWIMDHAAISSLVQLEYSGFAGATVPVCAFVFRRLKAPSHHGCYIKLSSFRGAENQSPRTLEAIRNTDCGWFYCVDQSEFSSVPGCPIAFWMPSSIRKVFEQEDSIGQIAETRVGMATGNNAKFVRYWFEVDSAEIGFDLSHQEAADSRYRWFPYANGGATRKWFGNNLFVVNWENDGHQLQTEKHPSGRIRAHNFNLEHIFDPGLTWSLINSSYFGVRVLPRGFLFSSGSPALFSEHDSVLPILALLNSSLSFFVLQSLNPTLNANPGDADRIPFLHALKRDPEVLQLAEQAVRIAEDDWNSSEVSWGYGGDLNLPDRQTTVKDTVVASSAANKEARRTLQTVEERLNEYLADLYGVAKVLPTEVPEAEINLRKENASLKCNCLVSYAIGCMMGRYSLDEPGLIYAHSGGEGFDPGEYQTFTADSDGIVPITEFEWFEDDAAKRLEEFIAVAWPQEHLEVNLKFVAECLGQKKNELPREAIRRYLVAGGANGFYKHHLSLYKKRPIYWLFSSGKQRAFQCLVYLHRYNAGTLSRMRTEYVIPLQGKIASRIDQLDLDIEATSSTSHQKKLTKERDTLAKHRDELQTFDEKLRHYADKRITLDLDDGVKVNYGKFGDLLAEVKAITGKKPEAK